jgi:hypothetical protein
VTVAEVTGYVQWLFVDPVDLFTKVTVGPSPTDTQLLVVLMDPAETIQVASMKASLIDACSAAFAARKEVTVIYDSDSHISTVQLSRA